MIDWLVDCVVGVSVEDVVVDEGISDDVIPLDGCSVAGM